MGVAVMHTRSDSTKPCEKKGHNVDGLQAPKNCCSSLRPAAAELEVAAEAPPPEATALEEAAAAPPVAEAAEEAAAIGRNPVKICL